VESLFTQLSPQTVRLLKQLTFSTTTEGKLVVLIPAKLIDSWKARADVREAVEAAAKTVGYTGTRWSTKRL
jgi:hypothetical protein